MRLLGGVGAVRLTFAARNLGFKLEANCSLNEGDVVTNSIESSAISTARLDRALEYAVIQSWDELMPDPLSGLIHIEYQTASDRSLDFLKIWSSTLRGHWNLICEYWNRPLWSHATGLHREDRCHSETFARTLEFLMRNADSFRNLPDQQGLIQVYPPTQEQRSEAERWRTVEFDDQGCSKVIPSVAA